ncbi:hypothetical protein J6590_002787 [Homalodisca vitripennis]|nr:hypothetical protein J6590_002787 [Homalodisca vitripennis]
MIRPTSPFQYEVECTVRSTVMVGVGLQTSVAFDISLQLAFYSPSQVGISAMFTFAVKYLAKKPAATDLLTLMEWRFAKSLHKTSRRVHSCIGGPV